MSPPSAQDPGLTLRAGAATDVAGAAPQRGQRAGPRRGRSSPTAWAAMPQVRSRVASPRPSASSPSAEAAPGGRRRPSPRHHRIRSRWLATPEQTGMGTTATGLAVVSAGGSDHWAVFNVGDFRLPPDRRAEPAHRRPLRGARDGRRRADHGGAGAAAPAAQRRHALLGTETTPTPDPGCSRRTPGAAVICSDGLSNELSSRRTPHRPPRSRTPSRRRPRWSGPPSTREADGAPPSPPPWTWRRRRGLRRGHGAAQRRCCA